MTMKKLSLISANRINMKKLITLIGIGFIALLSAFSLRLNNLFNFEKQTGSGMVPPLSLCGRPGARTILKIMDTTKQMAPLMENLGIYGMKVSTQNALAQKFFNQGLNLYYGFNHLEAFRSFKEAARLDPSLAMAYWGQALCLGPNINLPMDPADAETVNKAVEKSLSLIKNANAKEQALISALSKRYTTQALKDRKPLDEAYAQAMSETAKQFPDDQEINTLYAEALMDLHPWDFWKNGKAQPWTNQPVEIIAGVIAKNNNHPGANHLNIHILEASPEPEKAVLSADRLTMLVPGSGHLVHMPSHIYIRLGRYIDGVRSNEEAVKTDENYIAQCKAQGVYPLFYYPHNYHFLLACAQMAGMNKKSEATALSLQKTIPVNLLTDVNFVTLQHWYAMPWYNLVRFGQWDEILKVARPADSILYVKAVWHYARGMAFARTNKIKEANTEFIQLQNLIDDSFMENTIGGFNSFRNVLSIGVNILQGEIAVDQKNYGKAIAVLTKAIEIEDNLLYQEPPDWYHPARQVLGAVLLEANQPALAEQRFREDLNQYRDNGWSLFGLHQSLSAQGKKLEAAEVKKKFDKAFRQADIQLKGGRF